MNAQVDPSKKKSRRGRVAQKMADNVETIPAKCENRIQPGSHHPIRNIELYAWLGVDELGSGEIGLKQALMPAGLIPLVSVKRDRMESIAVVDAMENQAEVFGKKIRLCRFVFAEVVTETPGGDDSTPFRPKREAGNAIQ